MTSIRLVALLVVIAGIASAQAVRPKYVITKETSLSAAAEVITIQKPLNSAKFIYFDGISIYSSAECGFTLERDGSAASGASALTIHPLNEHTASSAVAYSSSNVGSGTVIGRYTVGAGGTMAIDLRDIILAGDAVRNISLRSATCTTTLKITSKWGEQ